MGSVGARPVRGAVSGKKAGSPPSTSGEPASATQETRRSHPADAGVEAATVATAATDHVTTASTGVARGHHRSIASSAALGPEIPGPQPVGWRQSPPIPRFRPRRGGSGPPARRFPARRICPHSPSGWRGEPGRPGIGVAWPRLRRRPATPAACIFEWGEPACGRSVRATGLATRPSPGAGTIPPVPPLVCAVEAEPASAVLPPLLVCIGKTSRRNPQKPRFHLGRGSISWGGVPALFGCRFPAASDFPRPRGFLDYPMAPFRRLAIRCRWCKRRYYSHLFMPAKARKPASVAVISLPSPISPHA